MPIYRELTGSTGSESKYRECRVLGGSVAASLALITEERVGALFFFFEFGWLTWGSNLTL